MKTTSILLAAAALAGSALAAPAADPKKIVAQEFDVSSFTAGCVPHGTQCSYVPPSSPTSQQTLTQPQ